MQLKKLFKRWYDWNFKLPVTDLEAKKWREEKRLFALIVLFIYNIINLFIFRWYSFVFYGLGLIFIMFSILVNECVVVTTRFKRWVIPKMAEVYG